MKFREDFNKEILLSLGFAKVNQEDREEDFNLRTAEYTYYLGPSRRGQDYYLIVSDGFLKLYATEADGSGGSIQFPEYAFKQIERLVKYNAFV